MFITSAYAQTATGAASEGLGGMVGFLAPLAMIMVVFYFFLIRPQQKRQLEQQQLLSQIVRGDTIVTSGGLIGKVRKIVDEREITVEISEGIEVRILRSAVTEVRSKSGPVVDKPAPTKEKPAPAKDKAAVK